MRKNLRKSIMVFLGGQLVVLAALAAVPAVRAWTVDSRPRLPTFEREPIRIESTYNNPLVVTDEQLEAVLHKLRPRFNKTQPKINYVDHALRFWGVDAKFDEPDCLSGEDLRKVLTDHRVFAERWGDKTRPLLVVKNGMLSVRTQQGNATASHVDHTLASLAEAGTPLDYELVVPGQWVRMQALLASAIQKFEINQQEYEWTTLAAALYAVDGRPWYAADGERMDFDRCARRMMRQQYQQGVCYGNHRLYTLVMLLRIDEHKQLLSPEVREEIMAHLREATGRLIASQSPEGYWDQNWPNAKTTAKDEKLDSPLSRRILATGHALEWWALAPEELHPPREVLVRAGQWLVIEIDKMDTASVEKNYTFLSHAGRALKLWRSGS
ncbi:MAG: hypothetical protein U1A77_18050 [Pirellulales bacterium]